MRFHNTKAKQSKNGDFQGGTQRTEQREMISDDLSTNGVMQKSIIITEFSLFFGSLKRKLYFCSGFQNEN
ncbi:hypothetical protein HMPREF3226_00076 [Prevotella corporis]|uniref:Uncharacterized protein n=1 Tax=Prevotella corporis TaxID=28128 RepID=A0A133QQF7_9BACT|nr:hypothetical protein HMPREF3226_00076 [Prevotella corporis]